jgi:hypothetical protein
VRRSSWFVPYSHCSNNSVTLYRNLLGYHHRGKSARYAITVVTHKIFIVDAPWGGGGVADSVVKIGTACLPKQSSFSPPCSTVKYTWHHGRCKMVGLTPPPHPYKPLNVVYAIFTCEHNFILNTIYNPYSAHVLPYERQKVYFVTVWLIAALFHLSLKNSACIILLPSHSLRNATFCYSDSQCIWCLAL